MENRQTLSWASTFVGLRRPLFTGIIYVINTCLAKYFDGEWKVKKSSFLSSYGGNSISRLLGPYVSLSLPPFIHLKKKVKVYEE